MSAERLWLHRPTAPGLYLIPSPWRIVRIDIRESPLLTIMVVLDPLRGPEEWRMSTVPFEAFGPITGPAIVGAGWTEF